jgi:phosphatidate cytidylyltransferase
MPGVRLRFISCAGWWATMSVPADPVPIPAKSGRLTFLLRFASTIVLWSVALGIIFSGYELAFFALVTGLGLIALWEFYEMLDVRGLPNFKITAMVCGALMFAGSFYYFSRIGLARAYDFEVATLLFFLLVVFGRQMFEALRDDAPLRTMSYTIFGLLYVCWLFNFTTKVVYVVPRSADGAVMGQFYVLYLVAVTKFSDMGAYLTGSLFGRHKLIPHISPKKTWEGFIGALLFSLLASVGMFWMMPERLGALTLTHAAIIGPLLGFAAVIGDLAESIIKRSTGVKDSGNLLPGIGGALDLIDSLLFTAPLLFFYLRLVVHVP